MKLKNSIFAMIAGAAMAHSGAMAGQVQINFMDSGYFNGTLNTSGSPSTVWATALFEDTAIAGKVKLTMTVSEALYGTAYVREWYFNVKDTPTLAFANIDTPVATDLNYGSDSSGMNNASGAFDLNFTFNTSSPGNLAQNANSIYEITGAGLTAASFNQLSAPGNGNGNGNGGGGGGGNSGGGGFLAAVKVQGDGDSFEVRGVLANGVIDPQGEVPEPGTLALIGLGLLGAALTRRRR
jgi:uncharacterized membrane protein YgcG